MFGAGNGWGVVTFAVVLQDDDPGGDLDGVAMHPGFIGFWGAGFVEFGLQFPTPAVRNVSQGQQVAEFGGVDRDLGGDAVILGGDACDAIVRALDGDGGLVLDPGEVGEFGDPAGEDFGTDAGFVGEEADPGVIESAGLVGFEFPQKLSPNSRLPCVEFIAIGCRDACAGEHSPQPFKLAHQNHVCATAGGLDGGGGAAGGAADDEDVGGEGLHRL